MNSVPQRYERADNGCWIWTGQTTIAGYGQFTRNRKTIYAHRAMYESEVGPIPEGLVIDHLCRTPSCVNPAHLEPVTNAENVRRGNRRKFSDEQILAIKADPRPYPEVAADYGTSAGYVGMVKRGQRWGDLVAATTTRAASSRTECPHGHPYSDENTYITSHGHRICRTCNRLRQGARRERLENA